MRGGRRRRKRYGCDDGNPCGLLDLRPRPRPRPPRTYPARNLRALAAEACGQRNGTRRAHGPDEPVVGCMAGRGCRWLTCARRQAVRGADAPGAHPDETGAGMRTSAPVASTGVPAVGLKLLLVSCSRTEAPGGFATKQRVSRSRARGTDAAARPRRAWQVEPGPHRTTTDRNIHQLLDDRGGDSHQSNLGAPFSRVAAKAARIDATFDLPLSLFAAASYRFASGHRTSGGVRNVLRRSPPTVRPMALPSCRWPGAPGPGQ